jgi:N-acetylglucosaminyldiphosphoundecaprenol N-acetyl-beta-D-mannosaminyltransferase
MKSEKLNLCGIKVDKIDYYSLMEKIKSSIEHKIKLTVGYANAHVINLCNTDTNFAQIISGFDLIHPDGIGIQLAFKYVYRENAPHQRFNGSDFYPYLISDAISKKWRIFFFGHDFHTLEKIKLKNPELLIAGFQNGYNFDNKILAEVINVSKADILVVGLGSGKQEKWIIENKNLVNVPVIIAVGDGIKVFAGTKFRGPKFLRKIGLEWFIRTLRYPHLYARRYLLGNPLFLYRIIRFKMSKLDK